MSDPRQMMISYRHKNALPGERDVRFIQYAKDEVPSWAIDIQPYVEDEFYARREWDTIHPHWGWPHNGIWVVRDVNGNWIDANRYRNDLKEKYSRLVIIDED